MSDIPKTRLTQDYFKETLAFHLHLKNTYHKTVYICKKRLYSILSILAVYQKLKTPPGKNSIVFRELLASLVRYLFKLLVHCDRTEKDYIFLLFKKSFFPKHLIIIKAPISQCHSKFDS